MIQEITNWVVGLIANEPLVVVVPLAIITSWVFSWILYQILGKSFLGADDDYWEIIRRSLLPTIDKIGKEYGLYAKTTTTTREYAGYVEMGEEKFEMEIQKAGYFRQPLSSLHENSKGWIEDGSWARTFGPILPIAKIVERIPYIGVFPGKFLRASDTVFSIKQKHLIYYTRKKEDGSYRVFIYAHEEYNPLNPIVAFLHYQSFGFKKEPSGVYEDLREIGMDIKVE